MEHIPVKRGLDSTQLKWIAAAAMLIDHVGAVFYQDLMRLVNKHISVPMPWSYYFIAVIYFFGRIAFPLFAFQVAEGVRYTKSPKRYLCRLAFFALLSEIPFRWMVQRINVMKQPFMLTNVIVTFFLAVLACICYQKLLEKGMHLLICLIPTVILAMAAERMDTDYGALGVCLVVTLYLSISFTQKLQIIGVWVFLQYGMQLMDPLIYQSFHWFDFSIIVLRLLYASFSILLLSRYNGKKGKGAKYFFYAFYPAHLWMLMLVCKYFWV